MRPSDPKRWLAWLAIALGVVMGCKRQGRKAPDAPPDLAINDVDASVDASITDATDAQMFDADPFGELPRLDDVPPLTLARAPAAATAEAEKLAAAALKKHLAGDIPGAVPLYLEALAKDPGHLVARYNLASGHARAGERGRALALLKQFKDLNCAVCIGRLIHARKDRDWEALWRDPLFTALTEQPAAAVQDQKTVTLRIAEAFRSGDATPLADVLHPRKKTKITVSWLICDATVCGGEDEPFDRASVIGVAELTTWLKKRSDKKRHAGDRTAMCGNECCELWDDGDHPEGHITLASVCYRTDSDGVTVPDELTVVEVPIDPDRVRPTR